MANLILLPSLVLAVCLVSGTHAVSFNNAYIQNVKSGKCVTIDNDKLLNPLSTSSCNCGPYQFWRTDGDFVKNELAWHGYMDELFGKRPNGETVGIYDKTGSAWQKWNINEQDGDSVSFVVRHTSKCLQQGGGSRLVQQDCNDGDTSQRWKIIKNPCGKMPRLPSDKLQLQNPATGLCAVIENNSNGWWAKVVLNKCSCGNEYHYWKLNTNTQMLPTIISQGHSKQCFANWEKQGHPGITQCICADDPIHRWRFSPYEDGSFNLISQVDAKCAAGGRKNGQLQLAQCEREDSEQKWRVYDECNPQEYAPPPPPPPPPPPTITVTNVIPNTLEYVFESGSMNWLSPTRYTLLVGGRWDAIKQIWYTADGREIAPNSPMWTIYFGDVKPSFLNVIFPGGKSWNEVFGWMDVNFFSTWTKWETASRPQPTNVIPTTLVTYFNNGQMNWLSPTRYTLLVGGRWDPVKEVWVTVDGRDMAPNSPMWPIYFGDVKPSFLNTIFQGGKSWNQEFGWMNHDFFSTWTSWQSVSQPTNAIPASLMPFFHSGEMNWLNPTRYTLLVGGRWDSAQQSWYTADGRAISQGSPMWSIYFGDAKASTLNSIFASNGSWNQVFGWMNMEFFTSWTAWSVPSPPQISYVYDPPTVQYVYDPPEIEQIPFK